MPHHPHAPSRRRRSRGHFGPWSRVIGIDDGPVGPGWRRDALVVGAVYRGGERFEGLASTRVRRDGTNATRRLIDMILGSKFHRQLHALMLDGIALGGLNVFDLDRLADALERPVVVVMRRRPDLPAMEAALGKVPGSAAKIARLRRAGHIHGVPVRYRRGADGAGATDGGGSHGELFCQLRGIDVGGATDLLSATCTASKIPEPIRAAHLIAAGIVLGQSGRRA